MSCFMEPHSLVMMRAPLQKKLCESLLVRAVPGLSQLLHFWQWSTGQWYNSACRPDDGSAPQHNIIC